LSPQGTSRARAGKESGSLFGVFQMQQVPNMKKGRSDKARFIDIWKFLIVLQIILLAGFVLHASSERSASQTSEQKDMKINSFDGVTIIVKDYEAQKKFYRDVLGLAVESEYSDAIFFKIGENKFSLFAKGHHKEGDASLEGASKGISHFEFGISSETNKLLTEKLTKAGFHAYRDVFKDADGNLFHFNLDGKINY
jgi:catechol 2,3-dioxygenase-like lactoylglutathione lyase family enzyme